MLTNGYVDRIDAKPTDFGTMYNLVVGGKTYGVGKFPPKGVNPGDYVEFTATQKPGSRFWNVAPGSLAKKAPPAAVAAPAQPARSGGYNAGGDKRQEIISKQAALNSAMNMVQLLVAADALPVSKTLKSDKKADLVESIVFEYTAKFYHLATGETYDLPDDVADAAVNDLASAEEAGNWQE